MWSLHTFKILIVREFGHAREQSKRQIMMSSWIQSLIILIHQLKMFSSLESLCQLWNFEGENDTNITETNMRFWQKCEVSSSSSFFFFSFFFFFNFFMHVRFLHLPTKMKKKKKKEACEVQWPNWCLSKSNRLPPGRVLASFCPIDVPVYQIQQIKRPSKQIWDFVM